MEVLLRSHCYLRHKFIWPRESLASSHPVQKLALTVRPPSSIALCAFTIHCTLECTGGESSVCRGPQLEGPPPCSEVTSADHVQRHLNVCTRTILRGEPIGLPLSARQGRAGAVRKKNSSRPNPYASLALPPYTNVSCVVVSKGQLQTAVSGVCRKLTGTKIDSGSRSLSALLVAPSGDSRLPTAVAGTLAADSLLQGT